VTSLEPPLPVPDDDSLDAAASALVDGVATPEEAALVAASPGGAARLAALRAVAEAVGRPGPEQDPSAAASALAAALAAFDAAAFDAGGTDEATVGDDPTHPGEREPEGVGGSAQTPGLRGPSDNEVPGPAPGEPSIPDLSSDREIPDPSDPSSGEDVGSGPAVTAGEGLGTVRALVPRRGSSSSARWLPRLGAVAAALVLLVGLAVLVVDLLGRAGDTGRSPAGDVAAGPTSAAPAGPGGTTAQTAMARTEGDVLELPPVIDGGAFGNETAVEAIALRAAGALDNPPVPPPAPDEIQPLDDVQRCVEAGPNTVNEELRAPLYQAEGTFQGIPAVAVAYERNGDPSRLLLVLARSDCALLERTPF
jgi:hypothetical protein